MVTYVKISELPPATEATGDSELEVNQAGVTRKITVDQVADVIASILPPPDMSGYATDEELADAIAAVELLPGPPGPTGPAGAPGATGPPGTTSWTGITDKPSTFAPDPEAVDDRVAALLVAGANVTLNYNDAANSLTIASTASGGGGGTVTSTSVVSANGLAGTVATPTTTPAITLSTTITGMLKGNATAISAATAGTDYMTPGNVSAAYLPIANPAFTGTMTGPAATFNGTVTNSSPSSFSLYYADSPAGFNRGLQMRTGTSARWIFYTDNVAESGGNAGSNFGIVRYSDAGSNIGTPLSIVRSTGVVSIPNATTTTQATADNTTNVATTAYVKANIAAIPAPPPPTTVSATPPGSPTAGALWWNSDAATGGGQLMIYYNDGSTTQWVPASPGMSTPTTPGGDFMATNSANISITSASVFQPLTLDTIKSGNASGAYSTSTGRYSPPAGRYRISIGFTGVNSGAAFQLRCALRKNGVDDSTQSLLTLGGAGYFGNSTYEAIVDASGTDYFQMFVYSHITGTVVQGLTAWFLAYPISGVKGPPGDPGVGLLQTVSYQTGAVATGTTLIPTDNTIPQITEGNEYMTLAITPRSATSKLVIDAIVCLSSSIATNLTVTLFQDSAPNALAAAFAYQATPTGLVPISLRHTMVSGTTSATTFRIRGGAPSAGTTTFNGAAGGPLFGGVVASSIVIQEVL